MSGIFIPIEGGRRSGGRGLKGSYDLARPPELTPEMAAARWKDVNRLLHLLVTLRANLRERRTLSHVLRSARALAGAERGVLRVRHLPSGGSRVVTDLGFAAESRPALSEAQRLATAAMLSRKPQLVVRPREEELAAELKQLGGGACLTVPVLPGGSPWGALQLLRNDPFTEEDAILVWIYVMALEEALGGSSSSVAPAAREHRVRERSPEGLPAFLRLLDEEMDRSAWSGDSLSVVRVLWAPVPEEEERRSRERLERAAGVVRRSLRPGIAVVRGGEGDLLVALPGADAAEAESACRVLRRNLVQSQALGEGSRVIPNLQLARATFPRDGENREELLWKLKEISSDTAHPTRS